MSFPMPPEGELSRESRPTTGKAPCICLAIPLIACMGPLHNLSSWEVRKAKSAGHNDPQQACTIQEGGYADFWEILQGGVLYTPVAFVCCRTDGYLVGSSPVGLSAE